MVMVRTGCGIMVMVGVMVGVGVRVRIMVGLLWLGLGLSYGYVMVRTGCGMMVMVRVKRCDWSAMRHHFQAPPLLLGDLLKFPLRSERVNSSSLHQLQPSLSVGPEFPSN